MKLKFAMVQITYNSVVCIDIRVKAFTSIYSAYYRDAPDLARTLVSIKYTSLGNSNFYADVI